MEGRVAYGTLSRTVLFLLYVDQVNWSLSLSLFDLLWVPRCTAPARAHTHTCSLTWGTSGQTGHDRLDRTRKKIRVTRVRLVLSLFFSLQDIPYRQQFKLLRIYPCRPSTIDLRLHPQCALRFQTIPSSTSHTSFIYIVQYIRSYRYLPKLLHNQTIHPT